MSEWVEGRRVEGGRVGGWEGGRDGSELAFSQAKYKSKAKMTSGC